MSGKVYRLKVTKQNMYKLVEQNFDVNTKLTDIEFLTATTGNGASFGCTVEGVRHYFALLPAGGRNASLIHVTTRYGDDGKAIIDWHACPVSFKSLKKLGIVEKRKRIPRREWEHIRGRYG